MMVTFIIFPESYFYTKELRKDVRELLEGDGIILVSHSIFKDRIFIFLENKEEKLALNISTISLSQLNRFNLTKFTKAYLIGDEELGKKALEIIRRENPTIKVEEQYFSNHSLNVMVRVLKGSSLLSVEESTSLPLKLIEAMGEAVNIGKFPSFKFLSSSKISSVIPNELKEKQREPIKL